MLKIKRTILILMRQLSANKMFRGNDIEVRFEMNVNNKHEKYRMIIEKI